MMYYVSSYCLLFFLLNCMILLFLVHLLVGALYYTNSCNKGYLMILTFQSSFVSKCQFVTQ